MSKLAAVVGNEADVKYFKVSVPRCHSCFESLVFNDLTEHL